MGLQGVVRQLAANCVPAQLESTRVSLVLDATASHLLTDNMRSRLQQSLSTHADSAVQLQISAGEVPVETVAQAESRRQDARQQAAQSSLLDDPNVKAMQDMLGASINEQTIEPI